MMKGLIAGLIVLPSAALAAEGAFFSLDNTDFVVWLGFLLFIAVLVYYKVPRTLLGMLDKRAEGIRKDLSEARELREEAQALLASYERKQKDVEEQANRIVASARADAKAQAERSREEMERAVDRRIQAAKDQIASAEEQAVRDVRNRAITVAVAAARDVLKAQMDQERSDRMIDRSIETVGQKLH